MKSIKESDLRNKILEILDEHYGNNNENLGLSFNEIIEYRKMINQRKKGLNEYISVVGSDGKELYKLALLDDLKIHPMTKKYPKMDENEFNALKYSLLKNWQIEPVLVYRGKIVDGRHRYLALKELGIPVIKINIIPNNTTLKEVEEIVDAKNSQRRHMTKSQQAVIAYKEWKENPSLKKGEVAQKYGIAQANLSYAEKIEKKLGSEILEELLAKGKVKIGDRYYNSLTSIVNYINKQIKKEINKDTKEPDDEMVKDIYDKLILMKNQGDIDRISKIRNLVLKIEKQLLDEYLN